MESKEEDKEEKEEEDYIFKAIQKKRKRAPEKLSEKKPKEKKPQKMTKQKILNEYYNLKPVIKIENNIRFIEPYEFKYQLFAKRRWLGKKLIDVLESEFHAFPKEYHI
jgi:hypothetical protein